MIDFRQILKWVFGILGISALVILSACTSATSVPGQTEGPEPVPVSGGGSVQRFSISSSNHTVPSDIVEEVVYYPGGAGDSCFDFKGPNPELGMIINHGAEVGSDICSVSCGWNADEKVQVTVLRPDGTTYQIQQTSKDYNGVYSIYFCYDVAFDEPHGTYTISYEGNSGSLQERIYVAAPDGPRLYIHDLAIGSLQLRYFRSNEHVRLLAYGDEKNLQTEKRRQLLGWQDYYMDSNGSLNINVSDETLQYVIVGDRSGEIWPFSPRGGTQTVNGIHNSVLSNGDSEVATSQPTAILHPQPESTLPPQSVTCDQPVYGPFESVWRRGGGASRGCPVGAAFTRNGAYQYFEKGVMIWHAGPGGDAGGMIYVIYDSGNWQEYSDRFVEGQTEKMGYAAPTGMLEPIRGFGKVWRDELGGPPSRIGWASSQERASQVTIQPFNGTGVILSCDIGTYFLPHGYKWNQ